MTTRDTHEVLYWDAKGHAWRAFDVYGGDYLADAEGVARKLAALFSAVEIHSTVNGQLAITRI